MIFFKPDDLLRRVETGNTSRAHSLKLSSHFVCFSLPSFYLTRRSIIGATDHKQNVPAPPHSSQGPHGETFGFSEKQQQRWTLCCLHGADHRESVVRAHGRLSGCCSTHRRRPPAAAAAAERKWEPGRRSGQVVHTAHCTLLHTAPCSIPPPADRWAQNASSARSANIQIFLPRIPEWRTLEIWFLWWTY